MTYFIDGVINVKKMLVLLAAAIGFVGSAQAETFQPSPYATGQCQSGCVYSNQHGGYTLYRGAIPKTYRICRADGAAGGGQLTLTFTTPQQGNGQVDVPSNNSNQRSCVDINSTVIYVSGNADIFYGPLP